jgi:oligogalacturonide lyase
VSTLSVWPSEKREFVDETTGAVLTQWTAYPAMHHHFYFTNPTATRDGNSLFGVHYRERYPNLMAIDRSTGEIRSLTQEVDINAFSPAPDKAGARIYYSARDEVRVVDVANGNSRVLCRLGGGVLGNCSLSHDDKWLAISWRSETCRLVLIDLETGQWKILIEQTEVGHIQFNPCDATLLEYSGTPSARIWTVRSDGSENHLLYLQNDDEWIVHESWHADGEELIFTHWPRALRAVHYRTGKTRTISAVNAWHAWGSPDGRLIVADTNHPDRGLLLIDAKTGTWSTLCRPNASCQGTQWTRSVPAAGAGIDTSIIRGQDPASDPAPTPNTPPSAYGPQWTHPHPTFTSDGKNVIYTSDRPANNVSGWSQIYSAAVPYPVNPRLNLHSA